MTSIQMTVTGAAAVARKQGLLTAGMTGIPVTFSFSQEWEDLTIIPVFRCGETLRDNTLEDMTSIVPYEVMQPGLLYIGAEGRSADGTVVIPTVWALVGQVLEGANATENPALAPTPSQYDRLNARITTLENGGIPEAQLPELFVVTVTGSETDGYTADRTIAQIYEAHQAKQTLLCKVTDDGATILLHPICVTNVQAWFFATSGDTTCMVKMTQEEIRVENYTHANANTIPTALPNPYSLTIGGKTYDGSEPIAVEFPQDGDGDMALVASYTLTPSVGRMMVDMASFGCRNFFIEFALPVKTANTTSFYVGNSAAITALISAANQNPFYGHGVFQIVDGCIYGTVSVWTGYGNGSNTYEVNGKVRNTTGDYTSLLFQLYPFVEGDEELTIKIWGC